MKRKYPKIITKWNKGIDVKFPNGENVKDVFNRLQLFIKTKLIKENKSLNKNVIVMTHNIVLRCLIGNFFNIDRSDWYKINIKYFECYEFVIIKNQLIPNIDRNKFQHLFKNINKKLILIKIAAFVELNKTINKYILKQKYNVKKKFGDQIYLNHPVHLTLFTININKIKDLVKLYQSEFTPKKKNF